VKAALKPMSTGVNQRQFDHIMEPNDCKNVSKTYKLVWKL